MVNFLLAVHFLPLTLTASLPKPTEVGAFVQQSCNDLDFGTAQVEQFIKDRPDTAKIIRRHSMLRHMLIWNFAGELRRGRIYWDDREPTVAKAEHYPAWNGYPSSIRVSKKQAAVDQCAGLLFELFNGDVDSEYERLSSADASHRKSKAEFVTSCVRHEFKAMEKVQTYFIHYPLYGSDVRDATWYLHTVYSNCDFDTYLSDLRARDSAYLKHYESEYDSVVDDGK